MANTSDNIRFQIFVAKPVLADMLLHTSTSLLSMNATYANLTLTLTLMSARPDSSLLLLLRPGKCLQQYSLSDLRRNYGAC